MNAKADGERGQSLGFKLGVERVVRLLGREGTAAGPLDMIGLQMGRVPKHHHRVADVLVDSPALGEKRFRQRTQMARGLAHRLSGSAASAMPVKFATSVNRMVSSCLTPPSSVEMEASMIP